jgi:isocitrate dehydrogenase
VVAGEMLKRALLAAPAARTAHRSVRRHASAKIMWTHTDEAPALASYALLPIIRKFTDPAGIAVENADISVAARIIAQFSDRLKSDQRVEDTLSQLGELAKTPAANIIKLPNVSASIPQLIEAIAELQSKGYDLPDFPQAPYTTDEQREVASRYAKVLGSAVNPVLREGNSDRRVAPPVKAYAMKNPHKMGKWSQSSKTHVAHMEDNDFFSTEVSTIVPEATSVRIELATASGETTVLKAATKLEAGEVIDASVMRVASLNEYFAREIADAHANDVMLSLHLKATMMKVSDPIMFGHAVKAFFKPLFDKHGPALAAAGANPNNGLGAVLDTIASLPEAERAAMEADVTQCYGSRPRLAMVDSHRGITNLHVPSDVIIDASVPVVVRDSGKMWNKDDQLEDTKLLIPDRSYARFYSAVIEDCKVNGQFDVTSMGNVANVGLMAQKAEEYGSHDKTFEVAEPGTMRVVDSNSGKVIFEHSVAEGDIWRMCQTKDAPIKDWVRLAVARARATGAPAYFWLDASRGHDASIIDKVNEYLPLFDTSGLDIEILPPVAAVEKTMKRARAGDDTISVTGNVLRDYLTDLFPILELGTSAKMLSIVPLLAGGGLFETGAGGSAPKHVQQFVKENHLRWDSLGEYLALAVSLEDLGEKTSNERAKLLGSTLNEATGKLLDERKSPSRKVKQLDNRGSSFYIAMYWAEAMAKHDASFAPMAEQLSQNEDKIISELVDCQGDKVDIGGYWMPDPEKAGKAMRPSPTLNAILSM